MVDLWCDVLRSTDRADIRTLRDVARARGRRYQGDLGPEMTDWDARERGPADRQVWIASAGSAGSQGDRGEEAPGSR